MEEVKYVNRYNDVYTFTKDENGDIIYKGPFKYCRLTFENIYDKAYELYCADADTDGDGLMTLGEFKDHVFNMDKKYQELIYMDHECISMVDPSGGPFLTSDVDMGVISPVFDGLIINSFVSIDGGFRIITNPL
jgi:hypothetical protein